MESDINSKKLIEDQKNANQKDLEGASIADLINKDSAVYKAPIIIKEKEEIPSKPTIDDEGLPILQTVRTYQGDLANAVDKDSLTLTKIALAEQNKKSTSPENTTTPTTAKVHLIVGIISSILFLAGVGAVVYTFMSNKNTPPPTIISNNEIISTEEKVNINISETSKNEFILKVQEELGKIPKDQTVRNIIPIAGKEGELHKASPGELFKAFDSRIPDVLLRSLYPQYVFGIDFSGKGEPFLILFTTSYDIAYASLLDWEGLMKDDLSPLFSPHLVSTKNFNFTDRVIQNYDTRSLEDIRGNINFFYSLIDSHTIIFAKSPASFKDILNRLREAKLR